MEIEHTIEQQVEIIVNYIKQNEILPVILTHYFNDIIEIEDKIKVVIKLHQMRVGKTDILMHSTKENANILLKWLIEMLQVENETKEIDKAIDTIILLLKPHVTKKTKTFFKENLHQLENIQSKLSETKQKIVDNFLDPIFSEDRKRMQQQKKELEEKKRKEEEEIQKKKQKQKELEEKKERERKEKEERKKKELEEKRERERKERESKLKIISKKKKGDEEVSLFNESKRNKNKSSKLRIEDDDDDIVSFKKDKRITLSHKSTIDSIGPINMDDMKHKVRFQGYTNDDTIQVDYDLLEKIRGNRVEENLRRYEPFPSQPWKFKIGRKSKKIDTVYTENMATQMIRIEQSHFVINKDDDDIIYLENPVMVNLKDQFYSPMKQHTKSVNVDVDDTSFEHPKINKTNNNLNFINKKVKGNDDRSMQSNENRFYIDDKTGYEPMKRNAYDLPDDYNNTDYNTDMLPDYHGDYPAEFNSEYKYDYKQDRPREYSSEYNREMKQEYRRESFDERQFPFIKQERDLNRNERQRFSPYMYNQQSSSRRRKTDVYNPRTFVPIGHLNYED